MCLIMAKKYQKVPGIRKGDPAVVEAYLGREMADEDIRAAMDA